MHETQKFGVDNPDQIYLWARISERYEYRLSGPRGNVSYLSINVYGGSMGRGGRRRIAYLNGDDLTIGPEETLVVEFTPSECRYWSFLLCNYWAESLEYRYRPVWTNKHRARYRPNGSVKIVVAHQDPGLPGVTWIDTEGHREGFLTLRWVMAKDAPVPTTRVVTLANLAREEAK